MEKLKIKHFMPSLKQIKDMVIHEVTYFDFHPNTRFKVTSRLLPKKGTWVNYWRSVPYVYKWSKEEEQILPQHYKDRCREFMTRDPIPVHWRPDTRRYRVDEDTGERIPVVNAAIPVVYPKECNTALWGGEGIIFGYYRKIDPKRQKKLPTLPRIWRPYLKKRVLYSEILDRWMSVNTTSRALYLIDENFGLDFYILKAVGMLGAFLWEVKIATETLPSLLHYMTHEVDLCSKLGMTLKREMLLALARKSMYPDDPLKRDKIYNKYNEFVIPEEEAEWVGLDVPTAVEKAVTRDAEKNKPLPLKDVYLVELVKRLQLQEISAKN